MLPVVTRALAKRKTREKSVRNNKERKTVCSHHLQHHFRFGGCLADACPPAVAFICTKAGEIESQSLMFHNWTDQYPRSLIDLVL